MAFMTFANNQIGSFVEKEFGNSFEYSLNDEKFSFCEDFIHKIWVGDGYRYGTVKKTVAVVCVDEDEYGLPVVEKWYIKNHREYV
jgi:hypothetical protein